MTFFEIIDLITFYGVDVVVLGMATSALTQILKTTILKNAQKKWYTFLPFVIGVIIYVLYAIVSRVNFIYAVENFPVVFEQGIKTGAAATVIYVVYEQFAMGKTSFSLTENAIATFLEGYVTEGTEIVAAAEIASAPETAHEVIEKYLSENVKSEDICEICKLLERFLKYVK